MPAKSIAQRRFFGGIVGGSIPKPKGMSMTAVGEFASTPEKGLPKRAPAAHMADGGDGHWMEKAFKNAGKPGHSLHASLDVPKDQPIPAGKLTKALQSKNTHMQRMAQAAKNAR